MTCEELIVRIEDHLSYWRGQPDSVTARRVIGQLWVDWHYAQALKKIADEIPEIENEKESTQKS